MHDPNKKILEIDNLTNKEKVLRERIEKIDNTVIEDVGDQKLLNMLSGGIEFDVPSRPLSAWYQKEVIGFPSLEGLHAKVKKSELW
ncbi:MAG: hypothetical protein QY306_03705 [Anaerolineales bacterium]|nr:MAG: hypothetical protein QY306_03705 [Anaerolineales bacterium]